MKDTIWQSRHYKKFTAGRDKALECIHQHCQMDVTMMMKSSFTHVESYVMGLHALDQLSVYQISHLSINIDRLINSVFEGIFGNIVERIKRMRKAVFILTYTSEMEALSRGTQKVAYPTREEFYKKMDEAINAKTILDETLEKRVWIDLTKLRYRLMSAINLAIVQELKPQELLDKIRQALPKITTYKRPPKELRPIREANSSKKDQEIYDFAFIDDADWDLALDAYKSTELPPSRFEQGDEYFTANWELEQDMTDDFVKQVRDGQIDAANELGIKDFVWVAVIDDRTDDCCFDRNGHTTSEIEEMLSSGKLDADKCDATSPPAHPKCRCQLGPVASTNEVEGPDWKGFQDWLDS